jgi:hypothetical protein
MFKKSLIALGLLAVTTLSGCVVYTPGPPRYAYTYGYGYACGPAPVVIAPVVPIFGFYGGWYHDGWHRHGGRWR